MRTGPYPDEAPQTPPAAGDLQAFVRKFDKELAAGITALALLAVLGAGEPLYGY